MSKISCMLVPIRYSHNHGTDVFFRVVPLPASWKPEDLLSARRDAERSVRDEMVEEYGEEEIERDEREYGGFESSVCLEDGDPVFGTDGRDYVIRIEPAGSRPAISREELAAKNKNGSTCAACGGPLKGPWPGMMYCPDCEG